MYGRRRVGKTFLLSRVWNDVPAFYFAASETTPAQNREALLTEFAQWSGEELHATDYPTWRSVFRLLLDHRPTEPLVITLDEFQYLGENPNDLNSVASELNAVWETRRPVRPLVFVIAGSAVRTLESLNGGGSPLYGRFAWQCRLRPFNYWHAGELAGFTSAHDRACAYGAFGGTPRYVAAIDSSRPIADNIVTLMLHPTGEVRELVQTALLQEQGLRDIRKYIAVLRAIGQGRTELNEIAQAAGIEKGSPLRDKIDRLIELDYVRPGRNLGAKRTAVYRYRVSDPAMRFFYDVVAPLESALATQNPATVWQERIAPTFDSYMGHVFETVVEEAYYRLQEQLRLPLVHEWGRWEGTDREHRPLEVDIASTLMDKRVLTGAIKWSRNTIDVQVHTDHLDMLTRLARSGVAWATVRSTPSHRCCMSRRTVSQTGSDVSWSRAATKCTFGRWTISTRMSPDSFLDLAHGCLIGADADEEIVSEICGDGDHWWPTILIGPSLLDGLEARGRPPLTANDLPLQVDNRDYDNPDYDNPDANGSTPASRGLSPFPRLYGNVNAAPVPRHPHVSLFTVP